MQVPYFNALLLTKNEEHEIEDIKREVRRQIRQIKKS